MRPGTGWLMSTGHRLFTRLSTLLLSAPLHATGHAAAPAYLLEGEAGATASADPLGSELCSLVAGFS